MAQALMPLNCFESLHAVSPLASDSDSQQISCYLHCSTGASTSMLQASSRLAKQEKTILSTIICVFSCTCMVLTAVKSLVTVVAKQRQSIRVKLKVPSLFCQLLSASTAFAIHHQIHACCQAFRVLTGICMQRQSTASSHFC